MAHPLLFVVLILLIAFGGCAGSSKTVEETHVALRAIRPDDEFVITFWNGDRLEVMPHQHRWTDSSGSYMMGRGIRRPKHGSRNTESYSGWLDTAEIDSLRTIGSVEVPMVIAFIKDGSIIYFNVSNVKNLPTGGSDEFWCVGSFARAKSDPVFHVDSIFVGRIDPSDVSDVKTVDRSLRTASYVVQGIGAIAVTVLVVGVAAYFVLMGKLFGL